MAKKNSKAQASETEDLGRIFEQSITELEILEAEAEGRPSVNKLSKRKRDGVYYTPEWVVERIVDETLGARLRDIKQECDWPAAGDPSLDAVDAYAERLKQVTVLDPACGSGAFLLPRCAICSTNGTSSRASAGRSLGDARQRVRTPR